MLWLLRVGVLGYRRWASGRGPLRRVRCTFEQTESCSAFGLRISRDAPNATIAVRLIRRRLRACGDACVHLDSARSGATLYWGPLYDRLHAPATASLLAWELPDTQAAVARVESVVREPSAVRLAPRALVEQLGAPRVLLRGGSGDQSRARRLYITAGSWALVVFTLIWFASFIGWLWPLAALACALGARATWRAWYRLDAWRERRAELIASADFEHFG